MKCPECNRKGVVLDTRTRPDGTVLRRQRCSQGHTWSTLETLYFNRQRPPAKVQ